jgi:replicative DNA helicase
MTQAEAALLGHLIGDGCTLPRHAVQYTTREPALAQEVSRLATEVFGGALAPRIKRERSWYQVYLASTRHPTHRVRNPVAEWLDELGAFGARAATKRVPEAVFAQPADRVALFLRHLWSTDGCIWPSQGAREAVYYATSSPGLARDIQALLLRLDICARVRRVPQGDKGRDQHHVLISGASDLLKFTARVGGLGKVRAERAAEIRRRVEMRASNTNRDVIPRHAWQQIVVPAIADAGVTTRELQASIGLSYCGSALYKANIGRDRAARVASAARSAELERLATSDVYWDQVGSIEPAGVEDVYDLTVDGLHNFVADEIVVHNSIEQDADLVMFIYRDEYYNKESERPGEADIIVAKHRNGPIGDVTLTFLARYPKFANMYKPPPGGGSPPSPSRPVNGDGASGGGPDPFDPGPDLPPPPPPPADAGSEDDPW